MTPLTGRNLAVVGLVATVVGLATTAARPGPDYISYRDWVEALTHGDLEELNSSQRSPRGSKLFQWLAGPALPYALPAAASLGRIDPDSSMIGAGAFLAVITAGLIVDLFRRLSGDRDATAFWSAAALVATPIGYYALAFSSESAALWLIALLLGALFDAPRRTPATIVGVAAAMLLMVRPYWAAYALPTLAAVLGRELPGSSRRRQAAVLAALLLPLVAAVAQLAIVNYWMTGDARRFPYLFGDAEFRSVDPANPQWGAVLWHPLHGWLVYHPAIGLGFIAMLTLVVRAPTRGEKVAWGALAGVVLLNVYMQASWYCWWMGTGVSLGMRGLVPAALPALAALARAMRLASSPIVSGAIVLLTTACGVWSVLQLFPGPTDYTTYAALFDGLLAEFDLMADPRFMLLALPALPLFGALAALLVSRDGSRPVVLPGVCTAALLTLWFVYAWTQLMLGPDYFGWLDPKRDPYLADVRPSVQLATAAAVALAAAIALAAIIGFAVDVRRCCEWGSTAVGLAALALFGVAACRIETGPIPIPDRPPAYPGKLYYVAEVRATYEEYPSIPGFDEPKRRLRNFMIREGIPLERTGERLPAGLDELPPGLEGDEADVEN